MRAALIGAGHIARQHLACLRELPGVELAGVCDLSRAMAECSIPTRSGSERRRVSAARDLPLCGALTRFGYARAVVG